MVGGRMSLNLQDLYCDLRRHVNHKVEIGTYGANGYGDFANIAIECMTCYEVLIDADFDGHYTDECGRCGSGKGVYDETCPDCDDRKRYDKEQEREKREKA